MKNSIGRYKHISNLVYSFILFITTSITSQEKSDLLFYRKNSITIEGQLQAGVNAVGETNLFWNLADVPELDFDSDTEWLELYAKPGLTFYHNFKSNSHIYAKISGVGSYTWGVDAFDAKNTGRITLEDAYMGYRFRITDSVLVDVSIGSQPLKLGTGMLISNGASSGFERGALKFGPRKAWQKTILGKVSENKFNSTFFYLAPNELPSNDTDNELAGLDVNYFVSKERDIGLSYIRVINSKAPYPQAAPNGEGPPTITAGDRKNLNALNLYSKINLLGKSLHKLSLGMDVAYQFNPTIDLSSLGGRLQLAYLFPKVSWKPTLMYSYQFFSGDNPDTNNQERFDPLYFEGSPSSWSTGSKSSMVFINSNVQSQGITFQVRPSSSDIITLRYAHIAAQQLRSPIQFGQAARVEFSNEIPTVIAGVTNSHLADDVFIEYNKIIGKHLFFNAGFSISFPGKGIRNITNSTSNWTGGFLNFVINY
ncbi:alginate export family protein [Aquimarina litoralis]|uniref:Alginate export family protein n=1 Tax=Aquimarina litoralis TaxID=584605 RepID=A0ABN1J9T3_9FLAO